MKKNHEEMSVTTTLVEKRWKFAQRQEKDINVSWTSHDNQRWRRPWPEWVSSSRRWGSHQKLPFHYLLLFHSQDYALFVIIIEFPSSSFSCIQYWIAFEGTIRETTGETTMLLKRRFLKSLLQLHTQEEEEEEELQQKVSWEKKAVTVMVIL